ncbi:zinc/iron-chelating domain-containing protein [Salinigranum rubrum]|uniref:Zinc/iron-chelating domain-containing protein n=1 Tax=Salinigranum rubrum TaxID=755307 RepID=A0A2I8VGI8_9EURY|nr:YkgJ family cysteine cluster protein [Salinigranum rubrum]AUV81038.1 zinc/iron-chelating domain-containing protein [Salinigranum rubrum]
MSSSSPPPSLETELARARDLDVAALADAIESIGFECTRCGACCKGYETCGSDGVDEDGRAEGGRDGSERGEDEPSGREPHTATVFPDEVRRLMAAGEEGEAYDWRDVARPMPYGLGEEGGGETFEWALQTSDCGDCTFYREEGGEGACAVHEDRPLVCRTYPFSVALGGTSQPMGEAVDTEGMVRAHECEGLGRDISREDAEELATALKTRAVRELEEAIGVRDNYRPTSVDGVVVHDSEGQKRPDGRPLGEGT